jgi:hypothetical protein
MQKNNTIVIVIFIVSIASTTLYIVAKNLPSGLGSHIFLWAPLALLIAFIFKPYIIKSAPLKQVIAYGIITVGLLQRLLWSYMDEWNVSVIFDEFYVIIFSTAILSYFYYARNPRGLALATKWGFVFILITSFFTLIALFVDPMIVRNSAGGYGLTSSEEQFYTRLGVGGYGFVMGLVCLFPIIIYVIKTRNYVLFPRNVWVAILLFLILVVVKAQIFANILVMGLITILSFAGSRKVKRTYFLLIVLALVFFAIPTYIYSDGLRLLSSQFPQESDMYFKLNDFASFIETPDTESTGAGARSERYPILFEAFIDSPIFGDSSYASKHFIVAGSHLHWMNRLTLWGLLGFTFYIYILFRIYKFTSSLFNKSFLFYYNLSVIAFVLLGLMKAITGREMWLMMLLIVPGMYYWPMISNKGKNRNFN